MDFKVTTFLKSTIVKTP